ncbi:MAG: hypothetical protein PHH26_02185 [Candidatus Thermoplasmatota archaeon]|nr:hypothetical protein [Candidatus Thermoplasmatota archaeon]
MMKLAIRIDTRDEKLYVAIAYGLCAISLLNLLPGLPPIITFLVPIGQFFVFRMTKTHFAKFGTAQALIIGILLLLCDFALWRFIPTGIYDSERPLAPIFRSSILLWIFNLLYTVVCMWIGNRALKGRTTNLSIITRIAIGLAQGIDVQ